MFGLEQTQGANSVLHRTSEVPSKSLRGFYACQCPIFVDMHLSQYALQSMVTTALGFGDAAFPAAP